MVLGNLSFLLHLRSDWYLYRVFLYRCGLHQRAVVGTILFSKIFHGISDMQ